MRVVNSATYRNFSRSVNDVHSKLNKSMNKVASGKAYESAANSPLAYYKGQQIDSSYQDTLSKLDLLSDVKSRLYQQELGAVSIQNTLSGAKTRVARARTATSSGSTQALDALKQELQQNQASMVNDLNAQYQNYYIFGGNGISTAPFSLSSDGKLFSFSHQFPGSNEATEIAMTLAPQPDGSGKYEFQISASNLELIRQAMAEQGNVDVGYGSINNPSSLIDTYTCGLNLITGLKSDTIAAMEPEAAKAMILERLNSSAIALAGQAAFAIEDSQASGNDTLNYVLGETIDAMTSAENWVRNVYTDLGNKYAQLESTNTKLASLKDTLTEQYTETLGADPREAITEMQAYQYSYNAALEVGSSMMRTSLFDFLR